MSNILHIDTYSTVILFLQAVLKGGFFSIAFSKSTIYNTIKKYNLLTIADWKYYKS